MKLHIIFFIIFFSFSYGKKIQFLKGFEKKIYSNNLEIFSEKKVIPFNLVSKTRIIYIYELKTNRLEYINYNRDDIEFSKSTYLAEDNVKRLISVVDCFEEDCH